MFSELICYAGRPFGQMKIRLSEINDQYECTGKVLMESDAKKDTFYVDNLKYHGNTIAFSKWLGVQN